MRNKISVFLRFLEYYGTATGALSLSYTDPLIRIEYDAINKDGEPVLALMAPFAHAINALCYRDPDEDSHYIKRLVLEYVMCHQQE